VLRFSCRQGALRKLSKSERSRAPKAVSCKRLLDGRLAAAFHHWIDWLVFVVV